MPLKPLASVAVLVTRVVPTGKAKPLAGTLTTVAVPQLSVALTLNTTLLVHWPAAALTMRLAGQVITGGCVSLTVTLNVQVLLRPLASVAVLVTRVVPTGKAKPLAGTLTTVAVPQLSVALTLNTTLLVHWPAAALTVRLAGQVITGGCVSLTVTLNVQMLVNP